MARIQSDLKLGFYPTSIATLQAIAQKIKFQNDGDKIKILDPCCGEGEALNFLGSFFKAETYGVEMDENRARVAIDCVDFLIRDSAFRVTKSSKAFELLFLNPPYGNCFIDDNEERLEVEFVKSFAHCVAINGYLFLVIGKNLFKDSKSLKIADTLLKYNFCIEYVFYDEDNPDYQNFGQYFIVLKRHTPKSKPLKEGRIEAMNKAKAFLEEMSFTKAIELKNIAEIVLATKSAKISSFIFRGYENISDWQIASVLLRNQDKIQTALADALNKNIEIGVTKSIESPNDGQAIILLMSGLVDNPIGNYLIKGNSKRQTKMVGDAKGIDKYTADIFGFDIQNSTYVRFV